MDDECKKHDECYERCLLGAKDVCFGDLGQDDGNTCQDQCDDDLCREARRLVRGIKLAIFEYLFCDDGNPSRRGRNRRRNVYL